MRQPLNQKMSMLGLVREIAFCLAVAYFVGTGLFIDEFSPAFKQLYNCCVCSQHRLRVSSCDDTANMGKGMFFVLAKAAAAKEQQEKQKAIEAAKNKQNASANASAPTGGASNGDLDEETIMQNRARMFERMNKKPKAPVVDS